MYFSIDLEKATIENTEYRKILYTPGYQQLVLMSIPVNGDIPLEVHEHTDQFFRFEQGEGVIQVENKDIKVKDGSAVIIPHGTYHRVVNTGKTPLKLYTIYSPPEHKVKKPKNKIDLLILSLFGVLG